MTWQYYQEQLRGMLDPERYEHSLGVRDTAIELARAHDLDAAQAGLAGLLHDCARCLPGEKLLELAAQFGLALHPVDRTLPLLLHAPVGAELARRDFGVQDRSVLRAIAVHTLGDPAMSGLDKVLFVADKVEPGRRMAGVEEIHALALQDLDRALLACYDMSLEYALRLGDPVHPQMVEARNKLILSFKCRPYR